MSPRRSRRGDSTERPCVSDASEGKRWKGAHESSEVERPRRKILAADEARDDGDRVGDVLPNDSQCEERADGGIASEREQADERGENSRDPDAVDGRRELAVEAVYVSREGKGAIAREGKVLARRDGELEKLVSWAVYSRRIKMRTTLAPMKNL
jgi:hypothetical protein